MQATGTELEVVSFPDETKLEEVGTGSESMSHDRSMKVCLPYKAYTISKSTTTQDLNSQV